MMSTAAWRFPKSPCLESADALLKQSPVVIGDRVRLDELEAADRSHGTLPWGIDIES